MQMLNMDASVRSRSRLHSNSIVLSFVGGLWGALWLKMARSKCNMKNFLMKLGRSEGSAAIDRVIGVRCDVPYISVRRCVIEN